MTNPRELPLSPPEHLVVYDFAAPELDVDEDENPAATAFSSTMHRVFERLIGRTGELLWLGIVETIEPGGSAWMDAFGASVVSLQEGANFWPGTERLSHGDARVRGMPIEAFGRAWKNIASITGEGFFSAFDPFLFTRRAEGDICRLLTVGHEGVALCFVREDETDVGEWLESVGFSRAESPEEGPFGPRWQPLWGVRSRTELVEIFGEESVSWLDRDAAGKRA